jgi:hypothetical protein
MGAVMVVWGYSMGKFIEQGDNIRSVLMLLALATMQIDNP